MNYTVQNNQPRWTLQH